MSLRSVENWKLVSGKLKKKTRHNLDGSTPEPAIRSGYTGQQILCFDSCQLTTTRICNIKLQAPKLARKCNIPHRASGWVDVRSRDYHKMGLRYEMTSNRSFFYKEAEGNRKRPIVEHEYGHPKCEHSQRQNISIKEIGQNSVIH